MILGANPSVAVGFLYLVGLHCRLGYVVACSIYLFYGFKSRLSQRFTMHVLLPTYVYAHPTYVLLQWGETALPLLSHQVESWFDTPRLIPQTAAVEGFPLDSAKPLKNLLSAGKSAQPARPTPSIHPSQICRILNQSY